jgi:hypothetical protein
MGLFGNLFEKKHCSICDGEIGLLGNRMLEDGNLCKNCAAKLSPWFSDRRSSTVEEIRQQLEYREANKAKVEAFNATKTIGRNTKVILDEDARKFIVTRSRNYKNDNPDVLDFADVTGCEVNTDESRTEVFRKDNDGKIVSYVPKRYKYRYEVEMLLHVNNPYFSEMKFDLTDSAIDMMIQNPRSSTEYKEALALGEEIKKALTEVREQVREEVKEANAVKTKVICPVCHASTIPDANGCCEYCGSAIAQ